MHHTRAQTKRKVVRMPSSWSSSQSSTKSTGPAATQKPSTEIHVKVHSRVRWRPAKRTSEKTVLYKGELFRPKEKPHVIEVLSWGNVSASKKDPHSSSVPPSEMPNYPFKIDYVFVGFTSLIRVGSASAKMTASSVKGNKMNWKAQVCGNETMKLVRFVNQHDCRSN